MIFFVYNPSVFCESAKGKKEKTNYSIGNRKNKIKGKHEK
jgi:hypothetical protein